MQAKCLHRHQRPCSRLVSPPRAIRLRRRLSRPPTGWRWPANWELKFRLSRNSHLGVQIRLQTCSDLFRPVQPLLNERKNDLIGPDMSAGKADSKIALPNATRGT